MNFNTLSFAPTQQPCETQQDVSEALKVEGVVDVVTAADWAWSRDFLLALQDGHFTCFFWLVRRLFCFLNAQHFLYVYIRII